MSSSNKSISNVDMAKSLNHDGKSEQLEVMDSSVSAKASLKGDWFNFILLIFLYAMQGLPLGIVLSMPIIFQSKKNVTFEDQSYFSMYIWPFSLKLLWAPIVDSLYIRRIGRRKSWLIPVQYLIGALLFFIAYNVDEWLPEVGKPNIKALTWSFFVVSFFTATQDIVIDGWAIVMLKKNNTAHVSTCNNMGLALGGLIVSFCIAILTSEEFCNEHLRKTHETGGIITIKGFLYFWGAGFMLLTTFVGLFKKEKKIEVENGYVKINVIQNYRLLLDILRLPSVRLLGIALLTMDIGFAAEFAFKLKLIDAGISKDDIMLINTSMLLVRFIAPFIISKYTSGPKPISAYLKLMPVRLFWGLTYIGFIYYTPMWIKKNGVVHVPIYYYVVLVIMCAIQEIQHSILLTLSAGFNSRICDARIGGTYMTMLNTINNIGTSMSKTLTLRMIDVLTFKTCSNDMQKNNCSSPGLKDMCKINNDNCIVTVNGYYVVVALCAIAGFVWLFIFKKNLKDLQSKSLDSWLVNFEKPSTQETKKDLNS